MPVSPLPRPPAAPVVALLALAVVLAAVALLSGGPRAADAAVSHVQGFRGTVLGWTSWYGSYGMGELGTAWCIDHGIRAPDPTFAYAPTGVDDASPDVRAAMAWALGMHAADDPVGAAAMMLALHDLMGAVYPHGRIDVDAMTTAQLSGFGGHEGAVVARARLIKDDALAHRHLRGPLQVTLSAMPVAPGETGELVATLTDANGAPVAGVTAHVHADGATLLTGGHGPTGADGAARFAFRATEGRNDFSVRVLPPDPHLDAWGPTTTPAQRVARPRLLDLQAFTGFVTAPPTGEIEVVKLDESTGEILVGVPFALHRSLGDGVPGEEVARFESAAEPVVLEGLAPGNYVLVELEPPPGYATPDGPHEVTVVAGARNTVELHNRPLATAELHKVPVGEVNEALVTLAGAELVVTGPHDQGASRPPVGDEPGPSGEDPPTSEHTNSTERPVDPSVALDAAPEVGRCTTDEAGRCALEPDVLVGGLTYCWRELVAPPGFGLAEPACFQAGGAGSTTTVEVPEPSLFTPVGGVKRDARSGEPLAGATYDLYRLEDPDRADPVPNPPEDAPTVEGHVWVARTESDEDGLLEWGLQIPERTYCAREHRAPPGYVHAEDLVCAPLEALEPLVLELANHPVDEPGEPPEEPQPPDDQPAPPPGVETPPVTGAPVVPGTGAGHRPAGPGRGLPITGGSVLPLASIGAGALLLGLAATAWRRLRVHGVV